MTPKSVSIWNTFTVRKGDKQYDLSASENGKVWIHTNKGEGGEFDGNKFFKVIDKFYKENF